MRTESRQTLDFVAALVDGRDPDLGSHQDRTGRLAIRFAERLGCSVEEVEVAAIGAHIHDIGKLAISDQILNKPGRLTASEYSLVKQHAEIGFGQVAHLKLDPRVNEIVRYHHENFDGTGYPAGLKGTRIPLLARVLRLIDTFDALTMDRPYHQGILGARALEIIERDARFYDPDMLPEFRTVVGAPA